MSDQPYSAYIPQSIDEILDQLGFMMLSSPRFEDTSGYFPGRNVETIFSALNEGLLLVHEQLGEQRYQELKHLSDKMRVHFEADPQDRTGDAAKGREIIHEMEDLLNEIWARELKEGSK